MIPSHCWTFRFWLLKAPTITPRTEAKDARSQELIDLSLYLGPNFKEQKESRQSRQSGAGAG